MVQCIFFTTYYIFELYSEQRIGIQVIGIKSTTKNNVLKEMYKYFLLESTEILYLNHKQMLPLDTICFNQILMIC